MSISALKIKLLCDKDTVIMGFLAHDDA